VREALASLSIPILCLVAKHDRLIPRSAARVIERRAPAARVVALDAPHCLLQCVPGPAAQVILGFVQEAVRNSNSRDELS
jgi:pimeloyl-ACP methyl ester carboxylesterase